MRILISSQYLQGRSAGTLCHYKCHTEALQVHASATLLQGPPGLSRRKQRHHLYPPNSGSFFKNAIIEDWQLDSLLQSYPDMPHYDLGDKLFKIPTGWLIEQCGYKGKTIHGITINDKNALVLINDSASSFNDLAATRDEIISAVRDTFRITIEQEPLQLSA